MKALDLTIAFMSWALCSLSAADAPSPTWPPADPAAVARWKDLRFGMFIHWGPVSLTGHEIGWSRGKETPIEVSDHLYKGFNPTVQRVRIEAALAERVQRFEFQYREGAEWRTIFTGQKIGRWFQQKLEPPVKAQEFRLNILDATDGPTIADIEFKKKSRP